MYTLQFAKHEDAPLKLFSWLFKSFLSCLIATTMLDFMDYIQLAFSEATNWNRDNSYSALTATAQCTLPHCTC